MKSQWLGPCAIAMAAVSGCALTELDASVPREEPVYVTGSNIARRHAATEPTVTTVSGDEFERQHIPQMPLPAPGGAH